MTSSTVTRRAFLGTSLSAIAATPFTNASAKESRVKIDRIQVFPVRYPTVGYFKFFAGPYGAVGRAAVNVKITADDGTVGWGQSVPVEKWSYETLEAATVAIRDYYAPELMGRDPTDIAGAHQIMDDTIKPAFSTGMPITRAGIDIALHDLTGKLRGQSLGQIWGLSRGGPITLSWTVNARTLDEADRVMQTGRERGYRNFNIKVAPDPKFDVQLARHVRQGAPDGFLWADANGGYDPRTALDVIPQQRWMSSPSWRTRAWM
jgi:muconate cycloisomerase